MNNAARHLTSEVRHVLARHWIFVSVLVAGTVLRAIVVAAYRPALMFYGDSWAYIIAAQRNTPPNDRPFGYPALLRFVSQFGDLTTVAVMQHLAGMGLAIAVYVVLINRGARPGLAAAASAPMLLDAYLMQIEHTILSETMFMVLLVTAVLVIIRTNLSTRAAAVVGVLLAIACLTRTAGLPLAAIFFGYLLVRRVGWRHMAALAAGLLIPVVAYMGWFASVYDQFGTSNASGRFLYGRVAVFADCKPLSLTPNEAKLCDDAAPSQRPNANFYVWSSDSPVRSINLPGSGTDQVASTFARKVILDQPFTYAAYVSKDVAHYFAPGHFITRVDSPLKAWQFPAVAADTSADATVAHNNLSGDPVDPKVSEGPAAFLRAYQAVVYTQGPLLLLGFGLGIAAGWLQRGKRRWDGPFVALVGLGVLVVPSATVMFDYRYGLPAIALFGLSGGIGGTALAERMAERAARRRAADAEFETDDAFETEESQDIVPSRPRAHRRRPPRPRWVAPAISVAVGVVVVAALASPLTRNTSYETYAAYKAELGTLGPALSSETAVDGLTGVYVQDFVTGSIVSTGWNGMVVPARYMKQIQDDGGLSIYGAGVEREAKSAFGNNDRVIKFQRGWIYWNRLAGTRSINGDIFETWSASRVRAKLREPLANADVALNGAAVQLFAGGVITRYADGSVQVVIRPSDDTDTGIGSTTDPKGSDDASAPTN